MISLMHDVQKKHICIHIDTVLQEKSKVYITDCAEQLHGQLKSVNVKF